MVWFSNLKILEGAGILISIKFILFSHFINIINENFEKSRGPWPPPHPSLAPPVASKFALHTSDVGGHQCCMAEGLGKANSMSCVAKNSYRKLLALLQIRSIRRALRPKCNAFLLFQIFHAVMTKISARYSYWQCMNLDKSSRKQTG